MSLLSGEKWQGQRTAGMPVQASGQVNGYAWLFKAKQQRFIVEIAEDKTIAASDLPLVGFGCSGWLFESDTLDIPVEESQITGFIEQQLTVVFTLFKQHKLTHFPAVSCPCSD